MPTDAGRQGALTLRLALVTFDDDGRASVALKALRHLAPHALTFGEQDATVDVQVAALRLLATPACDTGRSQALQLFLEAWLAFDALWRAQAKPGSATFPRTQRRERV